LLTQTAAQNFNSGEKKGTPNVLGSKKKKKKKKKKKLVGEQMGRGKVKGGWAKGGAKNSFPIKQQRVLGANPVKTITHVKGFTKTVADGSVTGKVPKSDGRRPSDLVNYFKDGSKMR